jgi:NNP family nitrate/nitrite transporter-like MFS transporter
MKLWPLFIFWCLWFLNYCSRTMLSPLLPVIEDSLSLSHGRAGGLISSLSIGYGISLFFAGRLASAWGYKRTVVFGFVAAGAALFLLQWADTYFALTVIFLLMGLTLGNYIPSILPIITEMVDRKHWGRAIALHDSGASFAMFAAPLLAALGLHFLSWKGLYLMLGMACFLLPIYFWRIAVEPRQHTTQEMARYADVFRNKIVWIMGLLWIVSNMFCNSIFAILPLYLVKERGIDFDYANTLIGISRCGGVFATILFGFLADRFGTRRILTMSIFATGLSTIAMALVHSLPFLLVILVFQAIVSLAFFPLALAAISKLTSPAERSKVTGVVLSIGVVFGSGVSPFLLGVIADHLSFQVGILGVGVVTTFSCLLVRLLREA